ncbi:ATP-binding protein [Lacrimispora sp. 210928-DFI.3.58]|uniref:ATP-binding protein n=1 Tax=Lacrimispora sp. 210928-DFI.3.58 TaxID=2883214 RepID=UPI0015B48614|nr:sensor histidine kinase [Lacrimispora sp. 210928-DFI.3.58]MCB7319815.1 GHKL domain-containing protein [Lacrimispora sp. 210928-DFI.3.58]
MTFTNIRYLSMILAETAAMILPFFVIFRKDCRFSPCKLTGILMGYLFFVSFLQLLLADAASGAFYRSFSIDCVFMLFSVLLCLFLTKTNVLAIIYTLFVFKNVTDAAIFCFQSVTALANANGLHLILGLFFLILVCLCACHLASLPPDRTAAYVLSLAEWRLFIAIPVIFFIMFRFTPVNIFPARLPAYPPGLALVSVCWLACVCIIHYVTFHTLSKLSQSYAIREQYKTSKLLTDVQTAQMEQLEQTLEQMMESRHNFRHHFVTVKGLLEHGSLDAALNYIDSYLGNSHPVSNVQYCSNLSANALLNYYLEEAQKHLIRVTTNITLPKDLPLPEIDFCTILGNLLSNALESCLRQESEQQPFITANICLSGESMITLSISNSYTHEIREQDGHFLSSKREHTGTGTASVRYLAERYHGVLRYKYGNGIFEASLLLNPCMDQG